MAPRTTTQKTGLADLSPEDRAALLEELRADENAKAETEAQIAEKRVAFRQEAIAELLDDRDHLRECPVADAGAAGGRVEMYEARRPAQPSKGKGPADVTVVRCLECGGSTVLERPYASTVAALDQATELALDNESEED